MGAAGACSSDERILLSDGIDALVADLTVWFVGYSTMNSEPIDPHTALELYLAERSS